MTSEDQERDIESKVRIVVDTFLDNPSLTNAELSKLTNVSKSSVQRYLKDDRVYEIYGDDTVKMIEEAHLRNKEDGRRKGGFNSTINNVALKDKHGKYMGNVRK